MPPEAKIQPCPAIESILFVHGVETTVDAAILIAQTRGIGIYSWRQKYLSIFIDESSTRTIVGYLTIIICHTNASVRAFQQIQLSQKLSNFSSSTRANKNCNTKKCHIKIARVGRGLTFVDATVVLNAGPVQVFNLLEKCWNLKKLFREGKK